MLINSALFFLLSLATVSTLALPTAASASTIASYQDGGIVDIMQVKMGDWQINGYGCANTTCKVVNQQGNSMTKDFHTTADYFNWTFSSKGWPAGTYQVIIASSDQSCSTVLPLIITK